MQFSNEDAPLAIVTRGALVESVHRGRLAVCDPDGKVLQAVGDPEAYIYARSSAKPFQALPLVLSGAADALGLTDSELAVVCASHNAQEPHLAAVKTILEKAGLTEDDLQSGAHLPLYEPEADELIRNGEEPRPIHGNCSGKHAGMLAVCVQEGYETATYRDPAHPLAGFLPAFIATNQSNRSASSMYAVATSTLMVGRRSRMRSISSQNWRRASGSTPVVGSSRMSRSGS